MYETSEVGIMLDPVLGSALFGIAGVSFLVGAYSAYQHQQRQKSSGTARQTEEFRLRQSMSQAKVPALLVFLPTAISSVLASLFVGRAGGPPPTSVYLMEIGGVVLILWTIIGGATIIGSIVGGVL